MESIHSVKTLVGMGFRSHDLGVELRMNSLTVDCNTFKWKQKLQ